ncbi:MAG: ABC transporter transmembrane domain-containing protein [Pseudomonadales bacterium]
MDDGYDRQTSKQLTNLLPAFAFLRPYIPQIVIASVALVVTATVTLSIGQGLRLVIDQGLSEGSAGLLEQSLAVFAVLVIVLTIGTFVRFYFVSWIGERVSADIRLAVFRHLIRIHPGFFERNLPTEIQSRITTDTTLLQTVIGSSISIALRNVLMFFGGVALLFVTNVKLSFIVLLSVPFVVSPIILFGRRVRSLSRSSQDTLADVGSFAGESLRHVKVVQSFNHEVLDDLAFTQRVTRAFEVAIRRIRQRAWLIALVMMVVLAAVATMLWVGGQDVILGRTSAGELAAFIFYAFIVAGSVGAITEVYADLQRAAGATERLIELMQSPNEIVDPSDPVTLQPDVELVLTVDDVRFTYPTRPDIEVLKGVTLHIAPGEMVALVGPSGAGKSTLFDLLQRFYDPTAGSVRLGGHRLTELLLADVRRVIGFVPQDPVLFAGSLRNNVCYGNPQADAAEVADALRLAHAEQFINQLPEGLDTFVGEGGVGLSGGQKQRLAIARALLSKPNILLLDEATSALDAESENAIRMSIDELKGKCSILVIAHRLSTVRQADRILVLEEGALIAEGAHDELVATNDLYARFARIQFASGVQEGSVDNGTTTVP